MYKEAQTFITYLNQIAKREREEVATAAAYSANSLTDVSSMFT